MNLAGVLPWIHWRGLVVLGLLAAGNVFCMACPFMVPRTLARRWLPQGLSWPRWLRNKWLAVVLLVAVPVGLRGVRSLGQPVVDRLDRPGLLCGCLRDRRLLSRCVLLQVCLPDRPVQFRAIADFAAGGQGARSGRRARRAGPRTASAAGTAFPAASCTCSSPGSRATWTARSASTVSTPARMTTSASWPDCPGSDLWHDPLRSGLGRFSNRPDLAALIVVLAFGAFVNAAGMVAPVLEWRDQLASLAGTASPLLVISLFYVVRPARPAGVAGRVSRRLSAAGRAGSRRPGLEVATRFSYALVPSGLQHVAGPLQLSLPGELWRGDLRGPAVCRRSRLDHPRAADMGARLLPARRGWLPRLEILFLDLGLLFSLYTGYRIALSQSERASTSPEDAGALGALDCDSCSRPESGSCSSPCRCVVLCQRRDKNATGGRSA